MNKAAPVTLSELLKSLPEGSSSEDVRRVRNAYQFAKEAHNDRRRQSRELYVEHDLAVAYTICGLGMDLSTIIASLLHDVLLPHTDREAATIHKQFGAEITELVTALDKLTPYTDKHDQNRDDKTLEAIRRAILTIVEGDTRVILIHLADRLQDLRKAGKLPRENQQQIALEVQDIHAPLANRLGIWQLKWELEDLAFRFLEPEQYRIIAFQISEKRAERDRRIREAREILKQRIREADILAEVTGRPQRAEF